MDSLAQPYLPGNTPVCGFNDPMPVLRENYRVFTRGERLIFGERKVKNKSKKYCTESCIVPPNTVDLLGPGAPKSYHEAVSSAISASVATKTKSSYGTALKMLQKCQDELGRQMSLPLSHRDVLCFVAYMRTRDVSNSTISSYLASIRLAMMSAGYECSNIRTPIVKQVLRGIRNIKTDPRELARKKSRRAMTTHHLRLLGHALSISQASPYLKAMVWAVSLAAFWGSLRVGEILCPLVSSFDVKSSCLLSDLQFTESGMKIWIRSPKVFSVQGDVVEIFEVKRSALDPVAALKYYCKLREEKNGHKNESPLFVGDDGKPFTRQKFNTLLHQLLDPFVKDNKDSLSGHSFRSGLATLMEAAGVSQEDIKAWGRLGLEKDLSGNIVACFQVV